MTSAGKTLVVFSCLIFTASIASIVILKNKEQQTETLRVVHGDSSVKIAVFNGCGRPGIAGMFAEKLRDSGFDVINGMGENADSFDYMKSVVVERKNGDTEKAALVARALGIEDVLIQNTDDQYIIEEVAVIIGRDWHTLLQQKGEHTD